MLADGVHRRSRDAQLARIIAGFFFVALIMLTLGLLDSSPASAVGNIDRAGEELAGHDHEPDVDNRTGSVAPAAAQRNAARALGATVRWNDFGTPQSAMKRGGFLATGVQGEDATAAARNFLSGNARLFGLSRTYLRDASSLRAENDTPMEGSNGHAVFFRQQFGDLPAVKDGSVTVGLTGTPNSGWKVAYVSSSLTRNTGTNLATADASISASEAWLAPARALPEDGLAGASATASDITSTKEDPTGAGFTLLRVDGLAQDGSLQ